jgi:hypothetical protein
MTNVKVQKFSVYIAGRAATITLKRTRIIGCKSDVRRNGSASVRPRNPKSLSSSGRARGNLRLSCTGLLEA